MTRRGWTRRSALLGAAGAVAAVTSAAVIPTGSTTGAASTRGIHLIGDSWAAGLHADPAHALGQVAARALRAPITVDAVSGTGYLNEAGARTYLQRARATTGGSERLVVVQGGSNDDDQDVVELTAAVVSTVEVLRVRFPQAQLLLLGPGPDPAPITLLQREVDRTIGAAAASVAVPYASMLDERWIPESDVGAVIDPDNHHPTVSGQQYLGLRLAAAVHLLLPGVLGR